MGTADALPRGDGWVHPDECPPEVLAHLSDLPDPYPVEPLAQPPEAVVEVPGSKSMTNRALVLAALADGPVTVTGALWADDTYYMSVALNQLGIPVRFNRDSHELYVQGRGGDLPAPGAELYTGNAGTATRFLTALCALGSGRCRIDGTPRMRQRPIEPLCDALRQWGAQVHSVEGTGCPPLDIQGPLQGGLARLDSSLSSQYLSALLMVGPYAPQGAVVELTGPPPARPYVDMTMAMMARQGVTVKEEGGSRFIVQPGRYRAQAIGVEPDASSAAYFWAAAAVTGGRVTVKGTGRHSLQGDSGFVDVLAAMGCTVTEDAEGLTVTGPAGGRLKGVDVDLNAMSDMTPTLASLAPFCDSPVTIRNVGHIRVQETDRIAAIAAELARLGISVTELDDGLIIQPGSPRPAVIQTYDDHRMAMAFALVGLRVPGLAVADPSCVAKSFPDYFSVLETLRDS
ncbi:MAG TPA: 3-phosphoshikimate 1-carboxyvinyltransferase [Sphingobacteriaceae bacterium]|nr:3-phosphoshikimate 1-carboxyvinyltransferase [Sphingobacteriaceae bacterium]